MTSETARRKQKGSCGFYVSPEMRALVDKPGFITLEEGGQRLRDLYIEESKHFDHSCISDFFDNCWIGNLKGVIEAVESGTAPDLEGHETDLRIGCLSFVVLGAGRFVSIHGPNTHLIQTHQHIPLLKYLISKGCHIDQEDICGYTALHHAVTNLPQLELARILLEHGADPNHQNKYGAIALWDCLIQNHAASMDLLLEHGADLEIADADGAKVSEAWFRAGPQIVAAVQKWLRVRNGGQEPGHQVAGCKSCGKDGKGVKLSLCASCRLVKYCSRECQKADWADHKFMCSSADTSTTLTLKPSYDANPSTFWSASELTRNLMGTPLSSRTPDKHRPSFSSPGTQPKAPHQLKAPASNIIIKAQIQLYMGTDPAPLGGSILVYNKTRSFMATIKKSENPRGYNKLAHVIMEKGIPAVPGKKGAKVYLQADLKSKKELVLRIGEILAAQPF